MDMRDLGVIGQCVSAAGAVIIAITAIVAARRYRDQVSLERMKWLQELYNNFYNSERYKAVRQLIDFDRPANLLELLKKSDDNPDGMRSSEKDQVDQFTDYLNFFEWMAYLIKEDQITFEQVDKMFHYYLVQLIRVDTSDEIRKYAKKKHFEELYDLLNTRYSKRSD